MPAEQAYKHIAGVEKEAKPAVSPRTKAEAIEQYRELLGELGVNDVFENPDAAEKFNDAMKKYKRVLKVCRASRLFCRLGRVQRVSMSKLLL